MAEKSLVIIPTYNELENIGRLIPDILEQHQDVDILIVDDNSPDGTGNFVEQLSKENEKIKLIKRAGKMG
ncbi:MAG: glycosyltransferase, partial [Ignavibacteriaceae bacterium]